MSRAEQREIARFKDDYLHYAGLIDRKIYQPLNKIYEDYRARQKLLRNNKQFQVCATQIIKGELPEYLLRTEPEEVVEPPRWLWEVDWSSHGSFFYHDLESFLKYKERLFKSFLDTIRSLSATKSGKKWLRKMRSPVVKAVALKNIAGFTGSVGIRNYKYKRTKNRNDTLKRMRRIMRCKENNFQSFWTFTLGKIDESLSAQMRTFLNNLKWEMPKHVIKWRSLGMEECYRVILAGLQELELTYDMKNPVENYFTLETFEKEVWPWIQTLEVYCEWVSDSDRWKFNLENVWTVEVASRPHIHALFDQFIPVSIVKLYWGHPVVNAQRITDPRKAKNYVSEYFMKRNDELTDAVDHLLIMLSTSRTFFCSRGIERQESAWKPLYRPEKHEFGYGVKDAADLLKNHAASQYKALEHNLKVLKFIFSDPGLSEVMDFVSNQRMCDEAALNELNDELISRSAHPGSVGKEFYQPAPDPHEFWELIQQIKEMTYDEFIDRFEIGGMLQMMFKNQLREKWDEREQESINWIDWFTRFHNEDMLSDYFYLNYKDLRERIIQYITPLGSDPALYRSFKTEQLLERLEHDLVHSVSMITAVRTGAYGDTKDWLIELAALARIPKDRNELLDAIERKQWHKIGTHCLDMLDSYLRKRIIQTIIEDQDWEALDDIQATYDELLPYKTILSLPTRRWLENNPIPWSHVFSAVL